MSFDWSEYLKLAQDLTGQAVGSASQEAKQRAAISRAYYAAFCKGRNYLRDVDKLLVPSGGRAHQYVREQFKKNTDRFRKRIGYNLDRLRSDRNKADYDDDVTTLEMTASADLALAERIFFILEKL